MPTQQARAILRSRLWLRALPAALIVLSTLLPARALAASDCGLSRIVGALHGVNPTYSSSVGWEQLDWTAAADDGVELDDGAVTLTVPPGNARGAATGRTFTNVMIEVQVAEPAGALNALYVITVRHIDAENYISFLIAPQQRGYSIELWRQGSPTVLADVADVDADLMGPAGATGLTFGILAVGNIVGFTINGRLVDWVEEKQIYDVSDFQTGAIGLVAVNLDDEEIVAELYPTQIWHLDQLADDVDLTIDCEIVGNIVQQGKAARATLPLFSDDFSRNAGDWKVWTEAISTGQIANGRLVLDVRNTNRIVSSLLYGLSASNYVVEADAVQTGGDLGSSVGLIVDYVDADNYTRLDVLSDGRWSVKHRVRGNWREQVSPTAHAAIKSGVGSANRLTAIAAGSYLLFLVNDELVGWLPRRLTDGRVTENGEFALAASTTGTNAVTASFDDVKLWVLPDTEP